MPKDLTYWQLGIGNRKPGAPHGITVLGPATNAEIIAAVELRFR